MGDTETARGGWVPTGGGTTGELIRTMDWSQTDVGPMATWPASLRIFVQTMLHSRHPMFLFWGPNLTQFYNDAYLPSFGEGKHPKAMGQRGADCWGEIWAIIGPQIEGVMTSGTPTWHEDALVPIYRNGRIEEVFWTYGYSPAYADDGRIAGTLVVCTETTEGVLANRRLRLTAAVAARAGRLDGASEVIERAFDCFAELDADLPFAIAFRNRGEKLEALSGLSEAEIPAELGGHLPALESGTVFTLDEPITAGPWPEKITHVFATPLGERAALVFGLSPRLPFDDAYRDFLLQLAETVEGALDRAGAIAHRLSVESERRNLLMQAPVAAALIVGPEHRFELANSRYVEMVGREVLGKTYIEAFPEIAGTPVAQLVTNVYESGIPFSTDEMMVQFDRNRDGVLRDAFFKFTLQPLRQGTGEVYGMMAVAVDITEIVVAREVQKRAHEDLQRSHDERADLIEQLEGANRAKDEFLAMLGHELRNPLAPIVAALELSRMRGGELSREQLLIKRQVDHLIRLVDDLLDVARIARGKVVLKKEVCEIGGVVRRAIEMVDFMLENRQHRLTVDVSDTISWWGDPARLAQVISNLLTNAARYTEPGGDIRVSAGVVDDAIEITVADNGNGIAPEMLAEVFEMFVQGRRKVDRADGGLGLGLTLVKNLVELHGGRVSATSEGVGFGSTFVVRLPATQSRSAVPPKALPTESTSKRVLVVDDNVDAADLLGDLLEAAGHVVKVAHDGPSGLQTFDQFQPEVAVLDIGLPVMDGFELAGRIRDKLADRPCLLIAVTGYGQRHDRERSKEAGFDVHMVKPVSFDALSRTIAEGAPAAAES